MYMPNGTVTTTEWGEEGRFDDAILLRTRRIRTPVKWWIIVAPVPRELGAASLGVKNGTGAYT